MHFVCPGLANCSSGQVVRTNNSLMKAVYFVRERNPPWWIPHCMVYQSDTSPSTRIQHLKSWYARYRSRNNFLRPLTPISCSLWNSPLVQTVSNALETSKYETNTLRLVSKAVDTVSSIIMAVCTHDVPFFPAPWNLLMTSFSVHHFSMSKTRSVSIKIYSQQHDISYTFTHSASLP